jgi:hypothetical protein
MAKRGGKREGAGRPLGARAKYTAAIDAEAIALVERFRAETRGAFTGDSLAYLQTVYLDPLKPEPVRIDAAKACLRFERPALAAVMTNDASGVTSPRVMLVPTKSLPDYSSKVSPMSAIEAIEALSEGDS